MMFGTSSTALAASVLAGLLAVATITMRVTGALKRAPLALHNSVWIATLAIIGTGAIRYGDVPLRSWFIIALAIGAYNAGALVAATGQGGSRLQVTSPLVSRRTLWVLGSLYAIGAAAFARETIGRYGLSTVLNSPEVIRRYQQNYYAEAVPLPAKLCFYLGSLVFVLLVNRDLVQRPYSGRTRAILAVAVLVTQMLSIQRANLFFTVSWQIGVIFCSPGRLARAAATTRSALAYRRRRAAILVLVLAAGASFQFIGSRLGKNDLPTEQQRYVAPWLLDAGAASAAIYATSGVVAFAGLMESENPGYPPERTGDLYGDYNPQTWGRATFQWALKLAPVTNTWPEIAPFVRTPIKTNVYTWFEPYYRDFREPGLLVAMFGVGVGSSALYRRRLRHAGWMVGAGLVVGMTAWAPFASRYGTVTFVELAFVTALLGKLRPNQASTSAAASEVVSVPALSG